MLKIIHTYIFSLFINLTFQFNIPNNFIIPFRLINDDNLPVIELGYENGKNNQIAALDIGCPYNWLYSTLTQKYKLNNNSTKYEFDSPFFKINGEKIIDSIVLKNNKETINIENYEFLLTNQMGGKIQVLSSININCLKVPYIIKFHKTEQEGEIILNINNKSLLKNSSTQKFQYIALNKNLKNSWKISTKIKVIFIGNMDSEKDKDYINTNNETIYDINNNYKGILVDQNFNLETSVGRVHVNNKIYQFLLDNYINNKDCKIENDKVYCNINKINQFPNINFILDKNITLFMTRNKIFNCKKRKFKDYCRFTFKAIDNTEYQTLGYSFLSNSNIYINLENNLIGFQGNCFKSSINNEYMQELFYKDKKIDKIHELLNYFMAILIMFFITLLIFFMYDKFTNTNIDSALIKTKEFIPRENS